MASLITSLAVSGSRKADGTANASGLVFLYQPGTTTQAIGYQDEDLSEAHTTVSGGIELSAAGKVAIWVNDPVDVVIQDADGETVDTLLGFNRVRAEQVEVENAGYTGALEAGDGSVTQDLGGKTDLNTLLTRALTSIGPDFEYLESAGATSITVQAFLRDVWISVRQFGADPLGVADSTTAIQQTIDRVKARGGGVVYFPPGIYKISSALTLASANGVTFQGSGNAVALNSAVQIRNSSTTANVFTLSSCSDIRFAGIYVLHSASTSSGSAVALAGCTGITVDHCTITSHRFGVDFSAACNTTLLNNVTISTDGNSASRAVRYNLTGLTATKHRIINGTIGAATGNAVEYNGTVSAAVIHGTHFASSAGGVLFNASLTGTKFAVTDCSGLDSLTTAFDLSGLSTDPIFSQSGNQIDGYVVTQASGGGGGSSHTPNRARGSEIHVRLTSGGAAVCTLATPTPTPTTAMRNIRLRFRLTAAAGGNITWTFGAPYVLTSGTTITGTDGNTDIVEFMWDAQTSEWRQCFASATTT